MEKSIFNYIMSATVGLTAIAFASCDDYMEGSGWTASRELQMDEYMETQPELSLFLQVVDRADLRGMIHAYGTYTMFVPNNTAVENYLQSIGKNSVSQLSEEEALDIVKYHLLSDTLHTYNMQGNTRLNCTNMAQDYLITKWNESTDVYTLNRTSHITEPDLHNGNGIIHVIDGVLSRPTFRLSGNLSETAQVLVDTLSAHNYGIMGELITDVYKNHLSDASRTILDSLFASQKYRTMIVQPDELMEKDGLTSTDALIEFLQKSNIKDYDEETLLLNWVGYHFLRGRYYISDLFGASSITTFSPLGKAIAVTASSYTSIHLNRFEAFNDEGIDLITDGYFVDYPCADGVIQSTSGELQIIERAASRINWDMCDVAEIRALPEFRKAGGSATFSTSSSSIGPNEDHPEWIVDSTTVSASGTKVYWFDTELNSTYSWYGSNSPNFIYYCNYETDSYTGVLPFGDTQVEWVYGDYLQFRLGTTVCKQVDIKTPTLVEGTYKIWLRLRRAGHEGSDGYMRMTFIQDGEENQTFASVCLANYGYTSSSDETDEKNAAKGEQAPGAYYPTQSRMACHLLGTVKVYHDGVHIMRWTPLDASQALGQYFDMIYFIPVDNDQVLPRVMSNGEDAVVYKVCWDEETQSAYYDKSVAVNVSGFNSNYRTHIWPYRCPVVAAMEEGTITPDLIGSCSYTWCPNHSDATQE